MNDVNKTPSFSRPRPTAPRRRFYRLEEAADLLAVSKTHVRNLIDCGDLTAVHVGRSSDGRRMHLRITAVSLENFQAKHFTP